MTESKQVAVGGRTSRNMLVAFVGNAFPPLVSLFSGPILAQALGVSGRGAVAAATAPFALVVAVVTLGVPESVTYAVARAPHLARNVLDRGLWLLLGAGVVATGLVFFASPTLSGQDPDVQHLMLLAAFAIIPNMVVGALRGVASATNRWGTVTLQRMLGAVMKLVLLVPFWLTGNLTPVVATVIIAAVPVLGAAPYVVMLVRLPPRADEIPDEARTPALLSYGLRIWAGSVAGIMHARVDQVLVTPLAGTVQMGLYAVAVSIGELPLMIHTAVRDVNFVEEATGSQDARLASTARISTLLTGTAAVGIGVTMIWWLPLLFGSDFSGAVPVTAILLAAAVVGTPGSIAGSALSGRGRPGLRSLTLAFALVVNVALVLALVPPFGAIGAAWATFGSMAAQGVACIYLVHRLYGMRARAFFGVHREDLDVLVRFARRILAALRPRRGAAR
ncbi:MAG: flippase [Brevundimonas sp.]